jgi:hypothetical protein
MHILQSGCNLRQQVDNELDVDSTRGRLAHGDIQVLALAIFTVVLDMPTGHQEALFVNEVT